jgi:hypothetical protein
MIAATGTLTGGKVVPMRRKQRTAAWLLGLVVIVLGPTCTSAQKKDVATRRVTDPEEACFNVRNVSSFSALNERFVYVRLLRGESYLLTLDHVYTSLPFATGITISNTFSRVCSDTGAAITFTDFGGQVSCRIVRVEAVADKEQAERLARHRTTPRSEG